MNQAAAKKPNHSESPAQVLLSLTAADMAKVDALITERMQSPVGMIPDLAAHLVGAGGKRLRPMLTIACARMAGYDGSGHLNLAAAVEFIHSATLLHDDVVDKSDQRRGKTAANLIWGNAPSILVGDFLFARSFGLMVETGDIAALGILASAAGIIAEGEVQQLAGIGNMAMMREEYMQIIGAKTAALFAAACECGPVLAGCALQDRTAFAAYGQHIGLAFQIVDDVLDYTGRSKALGKALGDDFREGKMTLPVIIAYQTALDQNIKTECAFWQRVMGDSAQQDDGDLTQAMEIMKRHSALEQSMDSAQAHVERAKAALAGFPASKWKSALTNLADFITSRRH